MNSKILTKKELLLQDFSKLKNLLHHQLEREYAEVFIKKVFKKAQQEFERMIPELPLLDMETTNKHPYLRLFLFAAMSMAIYFSLNFYLKDKKLAQRSIFSLPYS